MNAISGSFRTAGILLAALLAASCADSPSQSSPRVPAALQVISGNGQSGPAGEELPEPITVRLVDANGLPVAGQVINFRVTSGQGSVYAGSSATNAEGIARERWTLGGDPALPQVLEARAVNNATGARVLYGSFTATATPAPAIAVWIDPLNPDLSPVGAGLTHPDTLKARVNDRYGRPVPGYTVTWTVASGGGRVPTGPSGTSVTDGAGVARMRWAVGTIAGPNTLTASVASGGRVTYYTTGIPRSPVRMHLSPDGPVQVNALGGNVSLSAIGTDQYGNTQPMNVQWTSLDPGVLTASHYGSWASPFVLRNGTARIRAAFNAMVDTVTVHIRQVPTSVVLTLGYRTSLRVGETFRPTANVRDSNNYAVADSISGLTFHSSNPAVATVNASGEVTGVSLGTFHLTAKTTNGLTSAPVLLQVTN